MTKRSIAKTSVRLLILAGALFMLLSGPLPTAARKLLPILSPLSTLSEAVAQRGLFTSPLWLMAPAAVLLLAVLKGRFFCQWLCPLGTLYSLPKNISLKKGLRPVRLNAFLFWFIIGGSLFGAPLLLWLDPLCTISRISAWNHPVAWIPGALIPCFLLLSFFQLQMWCTHLCPLGYSFDLLNRKTAKTVIRRDRRQFIAGLGLGGAAAAVLPAIGKNKATASTLPPGATEKYAETCTRCYACVKACPMGIIKIKKNGGPTELAMPELCFETDACDEFCRICTQVCPTGAIRELTVEAKRHRKIGEAEIIRRECLAWEQNEYCMVCHEFCPYSAIEVHTKRNGTACPKMILQNCRGCGACEANCPGINQKAILVHPVHPQQIIEETV